MNWCRIFLPLSFHGWKLWEIFLTIGSLVMLKNQESLIKSRCIMVSVRETIESEQYQQWKREIFFFFFFLFKAKSRIIRNNKNFFSFFFFSIVCLTLNIFILSTVFVHSILYHVILKCSFLSRLTKLCVVRNVLLCIKMLRVFFWFISVWSSSLVFLTIYLFLFS